MTHLKLYTLYTRCKRELSWFLLQLVYFQGLVPHLPICDLQQRGAQLGVPHFEMQFWLLFPQRLIER